MATVRVEWVNLSVGLLHDGGATNVIKDVVDDAVNLAVSETATAAESRPDVPREARYARVTAVEGNVIVVWGEDPTAAQDNGLLVLEGQVEAIPVADDEKLSFIELA